MKRPLLLTLLVTCALSVYAQVSFEPGYFLGNEGNRTDCLIKNTDKLLNPTDFEYKLTPESEVYRGSLQSVKEFGISNSIHRYRRFVGAVDWSSTNPKTLSTSYGPDYSDARLFLRILAEGTASLYVYLGENGIEKYFFKVGDQKVEQLLYKQYLYKQSIRENVTYRQQLFMTMKCTHLDKNRFNAIRYNEKSLMRVFSDYNQCVGSESTNYASLRQKGILHVKLRAGVGSAGLEVRQSKPKYTNQFKQETFSLAGLEASYRLPSNRDKWSVFFQPTLQLYKTSGHFIFYHGGSAPSNPSAPGGENSKLDIQYSHITLTLGARRHFFLNAGSEIFLDAGLGYNLILNPEDAFDARSFVYKPEFNQTSFSVTPSIILGVGYEYNSRISAEVEYVTNKVLLNNSDWAVTQTTPISLAVGYTIFGPGRK